MMRTREAIETEVRHVAEFLYWLERNSCTITQPDPDLGGHPQVKSIPILLCERFSFYGDRAQLGTVCAEAMVPILAQELEDREERADRLQQERSTDVPLPDDSPF